MSLFWGVDLRFQGVKSLPKYGSILGFLGSDTHISYISEKKWRKQSLRPLQRIRTFFCCSNFQHLRAPSVRVPVFPGSCSTQVRDRAEGDIQRSEDERLGPIRWNVADDFKIGKYVPTLTAGTWTFWTLNGWNGKTMEKFDIENWQRTAGTEKLFGCRCFSLFQWEHVPVPC